nr:helix-turn-helix transcriptional regulator [Kocuria sp. CNJ-770]
MTRTVPDVIGQNVRQIRERRGLTLDDIARESREYGLRWNTGRVSRIERGDGAVTMETLLVLALVLSELTGESVTPAVLLDASEPIEIAPQATLRPGVVREVLEGRNAGLFVGDLVDGEKLIQEAVGRLQDRMGAYRNVMGPGFDTERVNEAQAAWSLADERAARKLGVANAEFLAWSVRLWGHTMSAEVEKRAEPGASPQKKGRITRVLLDELRQAVNRGDD